jgi:hypothetical protein
MKMKMIKTFQRELTIFLTRIIMEEEILKFVELKWIVLMK